MVRDGGVPGAETSYRYPNAQMRATAAMGAEKLKRGFGVSVETNVEMLTTEILVEAVTHATIDLYFNGLLIRSTAEIDCDDAREKANVSH